jgi:hypothetical protein
MDNMWFDAWTRRRFGLVASGTVAVVLSRVVFQETPARKRRKKRRKCKAPNTRCGAKGCCPPGQRCQNGGCMQPPASSPLPASCPSGTIFCAGGDGGERGCFAAACCLGACSGATCCPPNQICEGPADGAECDCVAASCGETCCPIGQTCTGDACGVCAAGSPNCPDAAQCGPDCFCVTSVEGITACSNDKLFVCNDCLDDAACTTLLDTPALCIAGDCLGCPQNKGCVPAACPGA